jgi:hypothetical protein
MRRDRMLRESVRDRFIVTTTSGETWDGVLREWDETHLIFVHVKAFVDGKWVPFDGQLWLQRIAVDYMQKP